MRFFYVALAETRKDILEAIVGVVREWDERAKSKGVRVGVLVRYTKWRSRECIPCKLARENGLPVFVDNGAFSFLTAKDLEGTPDPYTLARWRQDYAQWLVNHSEDFFLAALPDIPVHGRRFLAEPERAARIRLSTRNQELFVKTYGSILPLEKLVPVVQGYEAREYEESYRQLEASGVLEATAFNTYSNVYEGVLAVGSVCVRKWTAKSKTGVLAEGKAAGTLKDWLPGFLSGCCRGALGFHLFGLHREAVSAYGWHPRFIASDTGAHGFSYKYKWKTVLKCRAPNTPDCAARAVDRQLRRTLQPLLLRSLVEYMEPPRPVVVRG